jgi:hypothetical protein
VETVRLAGDEEAPFVRQRLDDFADVLHAIGIPRRLTRSSTHWPAFAIELKIDDVFDQTPGPRAGVPIR